jgi:hypothetical protein
MKATCRDSTRRRHPDYFTVDGFREFVAEVWMSPTSHVPAAKRIFRASLFLLCIGSARVI